MKFQRRFFLLIASCAVVACGGKGDSNPDLSWSKSAKTDCNSRTLSGEGIGALRLGMPIDSMRLACKVVAQTKVPGAGDATVYLVLIGADSVQVWATPDNTVDWIAVNSEAFQTADSIGVGSTIDRLLRLPDLDGDSGDANDAYVVWPRSGRTCGLSFWIDPGTASAIDHKLDAKKALEPFAQSGRVVAIEVRGTEKCGASA